jgi:hypothetical protein
MFISLLALSVLGLLAPSLVSAHEAYVLPRDFFWQGIRAPINPKALAALRNPADVLLMLEITAAVCALIFLNFLFRRSRLGARLSRGIERLAPLGPFAVRLAIAAALFFGTASGAFLGAELPLASLPGADLLTWLLYAASGMILVGFLTEVAALLALLAFALATSVFGLYLGTYLNYFGELLALLLFGMRQFSFDRHVLGPLKGWRARWEKYGPAIVRICYGVALIYAGITVKFLHPDLTLKVINDWHLTQFHWLFPSDPLLVVLGGGLAEAAIGLFILVGFEVRMTVLISLFYITLSLLYFRELVWPHILLYGISINLLVQPETFTLDHLLFDRKRKRA